MIGNYKMNPDGSVSEVADTIEWGRWMEANRDRKIIARSIGGGGRIVSTVFLGLDHSWGSGKPVLFETMIFEPNWGKAPKPKTGLQSQNTLKRMTGRLRSGRRPNANDELDGNWQDRYCTIEEARLGHAAALKVTYDVFPGNRRANKDRMNRLRALRVAKCLLDEVDLVGVNPLTPGTWA